MNQFFVSALRSGLRGSSFQGVFVLGLLLIGVAYLTGFFSPRQPQTVVLDVGLSGLRFSLVLLSLFWIQELVGREIDRRTVIFALTYPVARNAYLLGRYLGILALAALATVIMGLLLWLVVLLAGLGYEQSFRVDVGFPFVVALFGIWLDVAVVSAFALFVAGLSTVPVLPLALGAAFAIGGRSFGAVRDYIARGADGDTDLVAAYGPLLDLIRWVFPDLSRLDWRVWPMYQTPVETATIALAALMALAYVAILLTLANHVFARREFS